MANIRIEKKFPGCEQFIVVHVDRKIYDRLQFGLSVDANTPITWTAAEIVYDTEYRTLTEQERTGLVDLPVLIADS